MGAKALADFLSQSREMVCYATSRDGVHWHKPQLGLTEYEGSRKNNIVALVGQAPCVFVDPRALSEQRYKMIFGGGPRLPHVRLDCDLPPKNIYHAIYGASSPDGIHWRFFKQPIIPWYNDTMNVCYWDDRVGKYVAFVRWNENMIYRDGRTYITRPGGGMGSGGGYRAIGRTQSADFRHFPPPRKIMEPSRTERQPYARGLDYYNTAALKYPLAADSYFMFSSNFYHASDTVDVHLCTSRNGIHYYRWREPFLGLDQATAFDSKSIYMASGMIRRRDELNFYYSGYDCPHRVELAPPYRSGIGRARLRLDGFVSQDAGWSTATWMSIPLRVGGERLQVNADAGAGGWLKVEILDPAAQPIPGFARNDADILYGNDVCHKVSWSGRSELAGLKGRTVRLRFIGRAVKLYAFQFVTSEHAHGQTDGAS